jgi:hypothetical protein
VKEQTGETVEFGDLILAIFDEAAQHSADPREVSHLATQTVASVLWRLRQHKRPRSPRIYN